MYLLYTSCGEGEFLRHPLDTTAQAFHPRKLLKLSAADGGTRKLIS